MPSLLPQDVRELKLYDNKIAVLEQLDRYVTSLYNLHGSYSSFSWWC